MPVLPFVRHYMDTTRATRTLVRRLLLLFLSTGLFSHQEFHDGASRFGNRRTGAEDGCNTCLVEEIVVLSRDNTTGDNHNVGTTEFLQFLNHLRHKGLVSCSQRGNTQYMHVVFNGLLGCLCRSLELWSYNLF